MLVRSGDFVVLRDGRKLLVSDAVDQTAPEVIENPDNLCIGKESDNGPLVVFPMSEVVEIS